MKGFYKVSLLFSLLLSFQLLAATPVLRVGVPDGYAPMSYLVHGVPHGISVEMWEEIAKVNHFSYQYVLLDSDMNENWAALHNKKLDILLGPATIVDATNVDLQNYTVPFFINEVAILAPKKTERFVELFSSAFHGYVKYVIYVYFLLFFIYINLIWLIEYFFYKQQSKTEDKVVPKSYIKGIWHLFYHHISFSDHFFKIKQTNLTRMVYVGWVYATFAFLTVMGATLTAVLTTVSLSSGTGYLNDDTIQGKSFAYMEGRPFFKSMLDLKHLDNVPSSSMEQAIGMMQQHQIFGVVNTQILLKYYLDSHHTNNYAISNYILGYVFTYIGLQALSPYAHHINDTIIQLQRSGFEVSLCKKYEVSNLKNCDFY